MMMPKHEAIVAIEVHLPPPSVADVGKVRLGGESPSFGPVRMAPANTVDSGKVWLGGESPSFGPVRTSVR